MIIASTEYWGQVGPEKVLIFRAEVYAPTPAPPEDQGWQCEVSIMCRGDVHSASHYGANSFQALLYAIGSVVTEERHFLLTHTGPLGLGPDDVVDDGGRFAREWAERLWPFDPRARRVLRSSDLADRRVAFVYFSEHVWDRVPKLGRLEKLEGAGFEGHLLFRFDPPLFTIDGQPSEYLRRLGCEDNVIVIRPRYGDFNETASEAIDFFLIPIGSIGREARLTPRDLIPMGPALLFFNGPGVRERVEAQIASDLGMEAHFEATCAPDQAEGKRRAKREYL